MISDVDIVRTENGYRLLHGHLRLATAISLQNVVIVEVQGDGPVAIVRTARGFLACRNEQRLPVLCD